VSNTSTVYSTTPPAIGASTESTVISSTVNMENQPSGQGVGVNGSLNITAGTGTTAVVVRVRAGVGTGGALIGVAMTNTLAAGNTATIPFAVLDPTVVGTVQYTVTVQQTGGSVAGTVNSVYLSLEPSSAAS
jgi:hypothetical protein